MKRFIVRESTLAKAKERADKLPLLNNSIRSGEGAIAAYIGEAVAHAMLGGRIADQYDYDIIYGENNTKIDVKTKVRTVPPQKHYFCSVADYNTTQQCDEYAFVSVLKDYTLAWWLGKISKDSFYKKALFYKKGDLDPFWDTGGKFYFRADCYNLEVSELDSH